MCACAEGLFRRRQRNGFVHILVTNDDGIYAPGLRALRRELAALGRVSVVAPASEHSAVSHSITITAPLVVHPASDEQGQAIGWAVEGSPADCVKLALLELLNEPPDLICSGINLGANVGINSHYSGTVAAAIEGAYYRITSVAISLEFSGNPDFAGAARWARRVAERVLAEPLPPGQLLNVNIPDLRRGQPKGIRVVPQGLVNLGEGFEKRIDPRGRTYYWIRGGRDFDACEGETDLRAVRDGYIAVTPLNVDMTNHAMLSHLSCWQWDPDPRPT